MNGGGGGGGANSQVDYYEISGAEISGLSKTPPSQILSERDLSCQ